MTRLHLPATKRGRFLAAFVVVIAVAAWAVTVGPLRTRKPSECFTIGKATTFVTGPVDKDGSIDYVTALNQRLSEGIKPADNASVLLWQALGPHPEGATMPPGFFHWLGMKRPVEHGDYWITQTQFLDQHPKLAPPKRQDPVSGMDAADQELSKATSGPWKSTQFPWIAAWIHENAKPLAVVVQATGRTQYFNPLMPARRGDARGSLVDALLPSVQKCRELANALVCRAMLALGQGRTTDAFHDLLTCHRLGRLIARGGTVIEFLVGVAIDHVADEGDLAVLAHGRLNADQILADLHDLQRLPPFPALADKVALGERLLFLDNSMLVMRGGVEYLEAMSGEGIPRKSTSFFERVERIYTNWRMSRLDWDGYLRGANEWFDRYVAALRIADYAARKKALTELTDDLKAAKAAIIEKGTGPVLLPSKGDGRAMCNFLVGLLMPAFLKIQDASDRTEQLHRNLYLAFALAAYRHDHGRYPAELSGLAPKYLVHVPSDLFTGTPLIYHPRADGYLLYSVGVNGKDEDGRSYGDDPPGDDLSVRMPPRPTKN
jgi:hypothetical protein